MAGPSSRSDDVTSRHVVAAGGLVGAGVFSQLPPDLKEKIITGLYAYVRDGYMQVHNIGNVQELASGMFQQISLNPIKDVIDAHFPNARWVVPLTAGVAGAVAYLAGGRGPSSRGSDS